MSTARIRAAALALLALALGACTQGPPHPGAGPNPLHVSSSFELSSFYSQSQHLLFIERSEGSAAADATSQLVDGTTHQSAMGPVAGCGQLTTMEGGVPVPLPLEHTAVHIDVVGPVAVGAVRQRFGNPFNNAIEAVYVFPLPHDAAVHDFLLTIGERRIRGVVREREEARELYEAARAQGYSASLLSQERPNVFTQNVANIAPGHSIDVELAYLEPVDHDDGWQELAFPMVVGPRYNPVGSERGVGAVARGNGGSSMHPSEVHYLRPGERSGHDIAVEVSLRPGLPLERIESPSHDVTVENRADRTIVRLAAHESLPNADFRLRWRLAHDGLAASLVRQGEHALLTLYPPDGMDGLPPSPTEHVFVLDTSGSMSGAPLAVLKRAMHVALGSLSPSDTFHLLSFSNAVGALAPRPLTADPANIALARRWLDRLHAGGGTEMLPALEAALTRPGDGERPRVVTFLTDGFIGNEEQVFAAIQRRTAEARVFAVGIGSSPNRWLLAEMAARSGGADAVIGLDEDPGRVVAGYFARAVRPALTELRLTWQGARAEPSVELPRALLVGRPIVLPVALSDVGDGPLSVTVSGSIGRAAREFGPVHATSCEDLEVRALSKVWARGRLAQLAAEARIADPRDASALCASMTRLALEHGLVSSFTSFLAIDSAQKVTDGGTPARVDVAVPLPRGVQYEAPGGGG